MNAYPRLACHMYLCEVNKLPSGTRGAYLPQINVFYLESALTPGEYPLLFSLHQAESWSRIKTLGGKRRVVTPPSVGRNAERNRYQRCETARVSWPCGKGWLTRFLSERRSLCAARPSHARHRLLQGRASC